MVVGKVSVWTSASHSISMVVCVPYGRQVYNSTHSGRIPGLLPGIVVDVTVTIKGEGDGWVDGDHVHD